MSVEQIALVLTNSKARGTAKVVLIGIANHDGDGGSWPSVATLSGYANVSERSVQNALQELVELGELIIHRNAGGTATTKPDRRPNRYEITLQNGVKISAPRGVNGVKISTERGEVLCTNGVKPPSPEPSFNHPENQREKTAEEVGNSVVASELREWAETHAPLADIDRETSWFRNNVPVKQQTVGKWKEALLRAHQFNAKKKQIEAEKANPAIARDREVQKSIERLRNRKNS